MSNKTYKIAEDILFSPAIFRLSRGSKDIKLSNKEAELLEMLCDNAGSVLPRATLQEALWPNQENTDSNLNRQILSLRRKLESFGLLDGIDTIPRVGYVFCAPLELLPEELPPEQPAPPIVDRRAPPIVDRRAAPPEGKRQFARRKSDRYLQYARITASVLLGLCIISALFMLFIYKEDNTNTLKTADVNNISLYITSETEQTLKTRVDKLLPLLKKVPQHPAEDISILVGKEAISYFLVDNINKKLSENIFLLRANHPVSEELQCVLATMAQQGENVSNNYYNKPDSLARFHADCQAPDNWIETTKKSNLIVSANKKVIVTTTTATDSQGKTIFNLDTVGHISKEDDEIVVEMKNSMTNYVDQQALINNHLVATLLAAASPAKQKAYYTALPGGIYMASYMGGIIIWPSQDHLKLIQRYDLQ